MNHIKLNFAIGLAWVCLGVAVPLHAKDFLTPLQVLKAGSPDAGPLKGAHAVTMSPDGNHVYTASGLDNAIALYARDRAGKVSLKAVYDAAHGVERLRGVSSLSVSPDGRHVYAVSLHDNSLLAFQRQKSTGQLSVVQTLAEGADGITGLVAPAFVQVSRDGRTVFVAGYIGDSFLVFSRHAATGK